MSGKITVRLRLGTMLLDHAIICFSTIPPIILFTRTIEGTSITYKTDFVSTCIKLLPVIIYLCKDCIGGRSVSKRILKLQVIDNKSNTAASPLQCFLRNVFILIWPVEVIVSLFNQHRRLGDIVAGTRLEFYNSLKSPKIEIGQILLCVGIATGLVYWMMRML